MGLGDQGLVSPSAQEVLCLGGSTNGLVTLGDNNGAENTGVDPPTGVREAPVTTWKGLLLSGTSVVFCLLA
ncbi:UNVERIFIED_CONTAM: hypothetical protein Sindi_1313500 [Sesamum indicum]